VAEVELAEAEAKEAELAEARETGGGASDAESFELSEPAASTESSE
jgi:hypothetical protein